MTDKQIIKTFSDGYCLVLHENGVSLRENNYTKLQIVVGAKTNELFEFVKELYLDNKAKEQECEKLKKRLESFQKDYSKLYQVVENKGYIKELDQLKAENKKLKQTLDEIEKTCLFKIENRQFVLPNVWQHFLNIINKAKEDK